jgi:UDP-N-acetylglucosamine--N-acetylmuramyl-(pentapeptide) pyrophosphoryl-undecaprenol N-acetylglucosamine transferase
MSLRVLLTGGGTGGHVFPALALAELLRREASLLYVGTARGLEARLVPAAGLAFETIQCSGMPRRAHWPQFPGWTVETAQAVASAKRIIQQFSPDVALGCGGYVSAPVLLAAQWVGVPYLIHEPDASPGLANRLLSRHAAAITLAFENARDVFCQWGAPPARMHVTGNPIRSSFRGLDAHAACQQLGCDPQRWGPTANGNALTLLVMGGSQGAQRLNEALLGALPTLLGQRGLRVIHQTGAKHLEAVTSALVGTPWQDHPNYLVQPFFPDMGPVFALANLAVCRAGSLTLSELLSAQLPSVLVPYPFAAADHQNHNADALVAAGAALKLLDAHCTAETLLATLDTLLTDPGRCQAMREACARLARPQASQAIVSLLVSLAK